MTVQIMDGHIAGESDLPKVQGWRVASSNSDDFSAFQSQGKVIGHKSPRSPREEGLAWHLHTHYQLFSSHWSQERRDLWRGQRRSHCTIYVHGILKIKENFR